jgi:hypothetical protein
MSGCAGLPASRVLAASAVAVSHTGDTVETVLATVAIPAGLMGLNGILRARSFWTMPSNTNAKTYRHRLGGLAGTIIGATEATTAGYTPGSLWSETMNRNSASSQFSFNIGSRNADAIWRGQSHITAAVNTAVAQDFVFTGQLGVGSDTITLQGYMIELVLP